MKDVNELRSRLLKKQRLTEETVSIEIHPMVTGLLSAAAETPVLEVTRLRGEIAPGATPVISVDIDVDSIVVRPGKIKESDRNQIEEKVRHVLLGSERFPAIHFETSELEFPSPGRVTMRGRLDLHGRSHPTTLIFEENDARKLVAEVAMRQTDFGLKLLTAFFGALRTADEVRIRVTMKP